MVCSGSLVVVLGCLIIIGTYKYNFAREDLVNLLSFIIYSSSLIRDTINVPSLRTSRIISGQQGPPVPKFRERAGTHAHVNYKSNPYNPQPRSLGGGLLARLVSRLIGYSDQMPPIGRYM